MNPFMQIVDMAGLNPIDSGKINPDQVGKFNGGELSPDFSQVLGGELLSSFVDLPGLELESTGKGNGQENNLINQDLIVPSLNPGWSVESAKNQIGNQSSVIEVKLSTDDSGVISNLSACEITNLFENTSVSKVALPVDGTVKEPLQLIIGALPRQMDGSQKLIADLNNITPPAALSDDNNIGKAYESISTIDIDKNMAALYKADSRPANILNRVESQLKIKDIKLSQADKATSEDGGPAKLELPTRMYIRVTPVSPQNAGNENDNRTDVFRSIIDPEKSDLQSDAASSDAGEDIKTNGFKILNLSGLEQKSLGKSEVQQLANQAKLMSDMNPTLTNNITKIESLDSKIETNPIKFVLPIDIDAKNIKSNHTVMIRMEPEHLGPIRMTVSSYNDAMTARLVVETPMAKAMVESNLNHLVDQLDRYGIKVDVFEVSVGNSEVGREFSKNGFKKFSDNSNRGLSNYGKSENLMNLLKIKTREHLYIGSSGVNCFA